MVLAAHLQNMDWVEALIVLMKLHIHGCFEPVVHTEKHAGTGQLLLSEQGVVQAYAAAQLARQHECLELHGFMPKGRTQCKTVGPDHDT